jgi:hypothetical protein
MRASILALSLILAVPAIADEKDERIYYQLEKQSKKTYSSYLAWKAGQGRVAQARRGREDDREEYRRWRESRDSEDRYERAEQRDRRPTRGQCRGFYEIEGTKMLLESLARRDARVSWERVVRSREAEEFADSNYATQKDVKCWKVGGFMRCKMAARACRA